MPQGMMQRLIAMSRFLVTLGKTAFMDLCVAIGDMLGGDDMEPSMPGYKTKIYFSLANLSFLTLICRPPNTKYKME